MGFIIFSCIEFVRKVRPVHVLAAVALFSVTTGVCLAANAGGTPTCSGNTDIQVNEINTQDGWSEVFVRTTGVSLNSSSNKWILRISDNNASPSSRTLGAGSGCVNSSGGACVADAYSSYSVPTWINFAGFAPGKNNNSQVALFAPDGNLAGMVTLSTGGSCDYTNTYWGAPSGLCKVCVTGVGSSIKDYFAVQDGSGTWSNSGNGNSLGLADGSQGASNTGGLAGCSVANSYCFHTFSIGAEATANYCSARTIDVPVSLVYADKSGNPIAASAFVIPKWSPALNYTGNATVTSGSAVVSAQTWSGSTSANTTTVAKTYTFSNVQGDSSGQFTFSVSDAALPGIAQSKTITLPSCIIGEWRMDEASWNGTAGEVKDSSGSNNHGVAAIANGSTAKPTTASASKAYTNGSQSTCNYGQFDTNSGTTRSYTYVALSSLPTLPSSFTFSAWIRSTNASQSGQRILVRDDAQNGWGFSLGDPGQAKVRFFNRNITNSGSISGNGSNPSCGVFCLDTAAAITNNAWFYVAVVIDTAAKTVTHYVYNQSGTQVSKTSSAYSGTWVDGSGTAAIGGGTSASAEGRTASFHFNGNIDEMRIYSGARTETDIQNDMVTVRTCPASNLDHVEFVHDGAALTCMPKAITVLGCTTAASCNGVSANQSSGVFSITPTAIAGAQWCADSTCATTLTSPFSVSSGTVVYLRDATARTDRLAGTSTSAATATIQCTNTTANTFNATTACDVTYADSGFLVSAPNHFSCEPQTVTIQAVKSSATGTSCVPTFQGVNRNVTLYSSYTNPASGARQASFNYVTGSGGATSSVAALSSNSGSPTTLSNLYFNSTGTATLNSFTYPDVGLVTLFPIYTGSAGTGDSGLSLAAVGGNSFIAAPKSFAFSAIPVVPLTAGSPFNVTVTAMNNCSTPAATPNFGQESTAAAVSLASSNYAPAIGNATAIGESLSGFSSGVASTNLTWKEVGTFDLTVTTSNYLASGLSPSSTQTALGRFIPAYFDTAVTQGCNSGGFTYSGQPFTVAVTARENGGATTANYAGASWAKTVTLSNAGSAANLSNTAIAAASFTAGVATTATPVYTFASPATAPTTITLRAVDTDNVSSSGHIEGTAAIRSGRVRLSNANGSELLALSIPAVVQYYHSAAQGWQANAADTTCTTLAASDFAFSFPVATANKLAACETALTATGSPPTYTLSLVKPGAGNDGWVDVTLNLGASASGNRCTAVGAAGVAATTANKPWLQFNWSGVSGNPTARARFGAPKSGPTIIQRELY